MIAPQMNFTVKELEDMIPKFASGVTMAIEHYADGWVSVVLGKQLHLGPVLISGDKLHIAPADREQVHEQIKGRSPEEVVSVQIAPVEGSEIQANYVAWLPEAEAETFRNRPFVRITSLKNLISSLFEAAVETNGTLDIGQFMNLLAEAKDESTNEDLSLSPLLLATEDDLVQTFEAILQKVGSKQSADLKAQLVKNGWLRGDENMVSHKVTGV